MFVGNNSKIGCEWDKECLSKSKQGSGWKIRGKEKEGSEKPERGLDVKNSRKVFLQVAAGSEEPEKEPDMRGSRIVFLGISNGLEKPESKLDVRGSR